MSIIQRLKKYLFPLKEKEPGAAYDLWASGYDDQPDNLMLYLDEGVFRGLLDEVVIMDKVVADIGCGTGRHWEKIYERKPARLIGYDVSVGMLERLNKKFPAAETVQLNSFLLPELADASCDVIISTLAVAHMEFMGKTLEEWDRVLKNGGVVIITDYHPDALEKGGKRTFHHNGKVMAVKNYIHSVSAIQEMAKQLGWSTVRFTERVIDESVKAFYQQQNALALFERFKGVPIIYGIHLMKADDTA